MTNFLSVPVAKLTLSRENVRRSNRDVDIDALAASIAAEGLLQNLIVEPLKKPGTYSVKAGGRRLRALQKLIDQGVLPADHNVNVLVLDGGPAAGEASLAENFQRLPMNPADECMAFASLVSKGATADTVATRFGVTTRFVEGRLRLADLAKPVFDALATGKITLGTAQAYATVHDKDRQERVFESLGHGHQANNPDAIRRQMLDGSAHAGDAVCRFVGRDAYLAAGGRIDGDLFSGAQDETFLDGELLEALAKTKLEEAAAQIKTEQQLGFVHTVVATNVPWQLEQGLHRFYPAEATTAPEAIARLDALADEREQLAGDIEHEELSDEEIAAKDNRLEAIEREVEALRDAPREIAPELREKLGTFVYIGRDGQPRVHDGLFSEKRLNRPADRSDADTPSNKHAPSTISQTLVDELATQRRQILAMHIAENQAVALDLAIFLLASSESHRGYELGTTLRAPMASNPIAGFGGNETSAATALDEKRASLDRSWQDRDTVGERFDAFGSLDDDSKLSWLAYTVAQTIEPSANNKLRRNAFHEHLGQTLGIDVAQHWRPTAANYFGRIKKERLLDTLETIGGPTLKTRYAASKKADVAATCESLCAGRGIVDAEVRERAIAYVPNAMTFGGPAEAITGEDETGTDTLEPADALDAANDGGEPETLEKAA